MRMLRTFDIVSAEMGADERADNTSEVRELASSAGFTSASRCRVGGDGVEAVARLGRAVGVPGSVKVD